MTSSDLRASALRSLDQVAVNTGFARAVVEGAAGGELWTDREHDPRAYLAAHSCGMSLVWGPDVAAASEAVVRRLRDRAATGRREWLQVAPAWQHLDWDAMLGAVPLERCAERGDRVVDEHDQDVSAVRRTRLNFAIDPGTRPPGAASTPAGVRVRRATEADYDWPGSTVPRDYWPDAAVFLGSGGGWVAEAGGAPAALAFCSFRVADQVELGVETLPEHRRRGLARAACAAMVADVLGAGLTPVWSCREDNTGSVRLAEALGFVVSRRLPYYEVLPQPPAAR